MDSNGIPMGDQTDVTSYFVDEKEQKPVQKDVITRWITIYICGPPQSSQEQLGILYFIIWISSTLGSKFH
jgi:hypothetical protein